MEIGITILHVTGIVFAIILQFIAQFYWMAWTRDRVNRQIYHEYSRELDITYDRLIELIDNYEWKTGEEKSFYLFLLDKYSTAHFKNRLSDFLGIPLVILGIVQSAIAIGLVIYSVILIFDADGMEAIVIWWLYVGFTWLILFAIIIYCWLCKVLTDRYPSSSRRMRKVLGPEYEKLLEREAEELTGPKS